MSREMSPEEKVQNAQGLIEKAREQGLTDVEPGDLLAVMQMAATALLSRYPGHHPVLRFQNFHDSH